MTDQKTIKELLLEGKTMDEIVAEGHTINSVRKAKREIENGIGVGTTGRKKGKVEDFEPLKELPRDNSCSTIAQYKSLAIAIVRVALIDLSRYYTVKNYYSANSLERWFREEASFLCDIDPEVLISAAKRMSKSSVNNVKLIYKYKPPVSDSYVKAQDHRRKEFKNGRTD